MVKRPFHTVFRGEMMFKLQILAKAENKFINEWLKFIFMQNNEDKKYKQLYAYDYNYTYLHV